LTPTEEELAFLDDVFEAIWDAIVKKGGKICEAISAVEMYGSAINGLAIRGNSDLDMSVTYPNTMNDKKIVFGIKTCLEKANHDYNCEFVFSNF